MPVSINVAGLFPPDISCCRAKIHLPPSRGNGYRSIVCPRVESCGTDGERPRGGRAPKRDGDRSSAFTVVTEGWERGEERKEGNERVDGSFIKVFEHENPSERQPVEYT